MFNIVTHSALETQKLGTIISKLLQANDIVLLYGTLGVGKSELTRGIAEALQIKSHLPSPTFTIMNTYEDVPIPLYHFDLYRIHDIEELYAIGLDEFIYSDGIAVIEWPENCPELAEESAHISIQIEYTDNDAYRNITIETKNNFRSSFLERLKNEYFSI